MAVDKLKQLLHEGLRRKLMGDLDGAAQAWKEALALEPTNQRAKDGLQELRAAGVDPGEPPPATPSPFAGAGPLPVVPPATGQAPKNPFSRPAAPPVTGVKLQLTPSPFLPPVPGSEPIPSITPLSLVSPRAPVPPRPPPMDDLTAENLAESSRTMVFGAPKLPTPGPGPGRPAMLPWQEAPEESAAALAPSPFADPFAATGLAATQVFGRPAPAEASRPQAFGAQHQPADAERASGLERSLFAAPFTTPPNGVPGPDLPQPSGATQVFGAPSLPRAPAKPAPRAAPIPGGTQVFGAPFATPALGTPTSSPAPPKADRVLGAPFPTPPLGISAPGLAAGSPGATQVFGAEALSPPPAAPRREAAREAQPEVELRGADLEINLTAQEMDPSFPAAIPSFEIDEPEVEIAGWQPPAADEKPARKAPAAGFAKVGLGTPAPAKPKSDGPKSTMVFGAGMAPPATLQLPLPRVPTPRPQFQSTPTPVPRPADEIAALLNKAIDLLDLDDHSGAIEAVERVLELDPDNATAQELRSRCEATLLTMFESKLGDLTRCLTVRLTPDEVVWLNLDHRAGFLLSMIDGTCSLEDLFTLSSMSRLDTARILVKLLQEKVIA